MLFVIFAKRTHQEHAYNSMYKICIVTYLSNKNERRKNASTIKLCFTRLIEMTKTRACFVTLSNNIKRHDVREKTGIETKLRVNF